MSVLPPWAAALKCSAAKLTEWQNLCPPDQSLIQWALLKGKIDQQKYLEWAREHYQLVSVTESFFHSQQEAPQFEAWSSFHQWTSACCPIYQWDDILYVGCLSPEGLPDMMEIRPILCAAQPLLEFWTRQQTTSHNQSHGDFTVDPSAPTIPIDSSSFDFANINLGPTVPIHGPKTSTPANHGKDKKAEKKETPLPPVGQPFNIDFTMSDVSPLDLSGTKTHIPNGANKAAKAEKKQIMGVAKTNPWSEKIFAEMGTHFTSKMIVVKMDEGFVPRYWSAEWNPKTPQNCPFLNVADANIFKIAFKSQRPFHGKISTNPVNDAFFSFWLDGECPEQITVQPVVSDNKVIAMIVGVPNEEQNQRQILQLLNDLSHETAKYINQAAA